MDPEIIAIRADADGVADTGWSDRLAEKLVANIRFEELPPGESKYVAVHSTSNECVDTDEVLIQIAGDRHPLPRRINVDLSLELHRCTLALEVVFVLSGLNQMTCDIDEVWYKVWLLCEVKVVERISGISLEVAAR